MFVDMPDHGCAVIEAISKAAIAWQTPAGLASGLGWDLDQLMDVLAALDVAGWLSVWDRDDGPAVTLSPLAAERLALRLAETGRGDDLRWVPVGEPERPPARARNVCSGVRGASFEFVADRHRSPDLEAEEAESVAVQTAQLRQRLEASGPGGDWEPPRPTLLIGQSLTPWPGPGRNLDRPCPACGTGALEPHMYCLCCDRWGLDGLVLTAGPPSHRPRLGRRPPRTRSDRAADEADRREARARRKAKLRARLAAQDEAERLRKRRNGNGSISGGGTPLADPGPPGVR